MNSTAAVGQPGKHTSIGTAEFAEDFWYSKRTAGSFISCLIILVQIISFVIPPFQSPDEPDHLKRAYLLSKGEVFLGSSNGMTGGEIDSGLLRYMESFDGIPFNYDRKLSAAIIQSSKGIRW